MLAEEVIVIAQILLMLLLAGSAASQEPVPAGKPDATKEFQDRVKDYFGLRKQVQKANPPPKDSATPEEIAKHRATVGAAIAKARSSAKQGDIFFPPIAAHIRAVVRDHLRGRAGAGAREKANEGNPTVEGGPEPVTLKVNALYPDSAPVSSVPPKLLRKLPALPDELQYRFVGRHLILLDATASIIVDYMRNVMP
ncbi:MAG: hypothetical protein ACRD5F_11410 [Candidatus Acidiferrales bacterium]